MYQKAFILWASWNVWRELVQQIGTYDNTYKAPHPTQIVGITNSQNFLFDANWIHPNILKEVWENKEKATKVIDKWEKIWELTQLVEFIKKEGLDWEIVFIDVTAWKDELLDFHLKVINDSKNSLVTANKNPLSIYSMDVFRLLNMYNWKYDTNTTVMWWAGILNFVNDRTNKISDKINYISWMFSWTLWYIMSELDKLEKPFSEIVKDAKNKWYTEPNPWDDLNWLDVARKLIILARYSWLNVDLNDIEIDPLINNKYSNYKWDEFFQAIKEEDENFKKLVLEKRDIWEVLRYVWEVIIIEWQVKLKVWLKSVPINWDLWNLKWTSNIAIIETDILKDPYPHVIKSRWAWLGVTAWSVRIWIKKMLPHNIISW